MDGVQPIAAMRSRQCQQSCLTASVGQTRQQVGDIDGDTWLVPLALFTCSLTARTQDIRLAELGRPLFSRISSWRRRVPAADAKKAEGASDDTRRIPRPPFLTGKLACSH